MATTSGMLALVPDDPDALAVPGGAEPNELHLTLLYLGDDVTDWSPERRDRLAELIAVSAPALDPVQARIFGHAVFNPDGGPDGDRDPVAVYLIGDSGALGEIRDWARWALGHGDDLPEQHAPFVPHITATDGADPAQLSHIGPVTFSTLRLALGGEVTDVALGREPGEKAPEGKGLTFTPPAEIRALAGTHRGATAHAVYEGKALDSAGLDWVAGHCGEIGARWVDAMRGRMQTKGRFEIKAMSLDPRAARLRKYWAHGKGRTKWIKSPHQFRALRRHLAKYVKNPRQLNGLTANIFKLATGIYPGQRPNGGRKALVDWDAVETKMADLRDVDEDALGEGAGEWGPLFEDEDLSDFGEDDLLGDNEEKAMDSDRVETSRLALLGQRIVADDEEEDESWSDLVEADDVWDLGAHGVMDRTSSGQRAGGRGE